MGARGGLLTDSPRVATSLRISWPGHLSILWLRGTSSCCSPHCPRQLSPALTQEPPLVPFPCLCPKDLLKC